MLPAILGFMIKVPEVRQVALSYSRWRIMGIISMAMTMSIKAFFDGVGRTTVHLVASVAMNAINVVFCWVFIFGHWGAPRMGVEGAGMSAFIATWIGLFIMMAYAAGVRSQFRPLHWSKISRKVTWAILKLSIPAGLATFVMMIGFALFSRIVGKLDALPEAAAVVAGQPVEAVNGAATTDIIEILKLTFTACIAFGTATATLVAQSIGAKKPDDAEKFGWASVRLGVLVFGVVGLCEGVFFTRPIVAFISRSPAVRAVAMVPMQIMGVVTPIIAIALILSEALFGAGNPVFVAVAQFLLVFAVLLPASYVLGIVAHFGLVGIFASACLYSILAAVAMSVKFKQGAWKAIRL
jgi:putative MATE family efflux protein